MNQLQECGAKSCVISTSAQRSPDLGHAGGDYVRFICPRGLACDARAVTSERHAAKSGRGVRPHLGPNLIQGFRQLH